MRLTRVGTDYIEINEKNIRNSRLLNIPRVHLIKFCFSEPNERKVKEVIRLYPKTNRFIVCDNVKLYNYILRRTSKKYYVMNQSGVKLITFFRKNNKVLVNFNNLNETEKKFLLSDVCFEDVLKNTEVIIVDEYIFYEKKQILEGWSGNVIIQSDNE